MEAYVWGALKLTSSLISTGWSKLTGDSGNDDSCSTVDTRLVEWGGDIVMKARDKFGYVVAQTQKKCSSHLASPCSAALEANRGEVSVYTGNGGYGCSLWSCAVNSPKVTAGLVWPISKCSPVKLVCLLDLCTVVPPGMYPRPTRTASV